MGRYYSKSGRQSKQSVRHTFLDDFARSSKKYEKDNHPDFFFNVCSVRRRLILDFPILVINILSGYQLATF